MYIYIYTVPQEPAQEEQDSMENELEEVVGVGVAVIDMAYIKKENNFHTVQCRGCNNNVALDQTTFI